MSQMCYNCFQPLPEGAVVCPNCGYDPRKQQGKYPLALRPGTVLNGQYILGRVLGQGGFGITYVAQDHKTGALVAVKEYFPDTMATRPQGYTVTAYTGQREENFTYGKECFLNEAKTLAEFIGNPNIVRVYSYFEENNTAYFVMEYVRGRSLQDYLKEHGRISWEEAGRILFPVMDALGAVHAKGIVHRDVTPDNIYLTDEGKVKLLDFGAARYSLGDRSRSLDVVLKHGFAPREQYSRHGRQGPFTDVYALGATFYYAITGRLPPDSIDRQDEDELILPSSLGVKIPPEVEDALCRALAVAPQDRPQNMGEFRRALTGVSSQSPPPSTGYQTGPATGAPPYTGGQAGPTAGTPPFTGGQRGPTTGTPPYIGYQTGPATGGPPFTGGQRGPTAGAPPFTGGQTGPVTGAPPFAGGKKKKKRAQVPPMDSQSKKKLRWVLAVGLVACVGLVISLAVIPLWGQTSEETGSSQSQKGTSSGTSSAQAGEALGQDAQETETVSLQTKFTFYTEDGSLEDYTEYEYDQCGNRTASIYYEIPGVVGHRYEYEYDAQGNEIGSTSYDGDGARTSWDETVFDQEGNELGSRYYDEYGMLESWNRYEYDDNGFQVKYSSYDENGAVTWWEEFTCDSQGNHVEIREYNADGTLDSFTKQEFDGENRLLKCWYYDENMESDGWSEYQYGGDDNQVSYVKYDADGTLGYQWEKKFDEHGNVVSDVTRFSTGSVSTYTYENEYDGSGLLLKRTSYYDGDLWYIAEYEVKEISTQPAVELEPASDFGEDLISVLDTIETQSDGEGNGFVKDSSYTPVGMVMDANNDGFPEFLAMYEFQDSEDGLSFGFDLYTFTEYGPVRLDGGALCAMAGGNSGSIGLAVDQKGKHYLHALVKSPTGDGPQNTDVYFGLETTEYMTTLDAEDMITFYYQANVASQLYYYKLNGSDADKETFETAKGKFTEVCLLDLLAGPGNRALSFDQLRQIYS